MRNLNEIFADNHDARIAEHFVTVMGTAAPPTIVRDFDGKYHQVGKDGSTTLKDEHSAVLRTLQRSQIITSADKPERIGRDLVGYRMALARD